MSKSFYLVLPSNSPSYTDNSPNSFRVKLPVPLKFDDSNWLCGLSSIQFPYSWPSIGTDSPQYMDIFLKSRQTIRVPIPKGNFRTPQAFDKLLSNIPHESGVCRFLESYRDVFKRILEQKAKIAALGQTAGGRKRRGVDLEDGSDDVAEDGVGRGDGGRRGGRESDDDDEDDADYEVVRKKRKVEDSKASASVPGENPRVNDYVAPQSNPTVSDHQRVAQNPPADAKNTADSRTDQQQSSQEQHRQRQGQSLPLVQEGKKPEDTRMNLTDRSDILNLDPPPVKPNYLPDIGTPYPGGQQWTAEAFGRVLSEQKFYAEPPPPAAKSEYNMHMDDLYKGLNLKMGQDGDKWDFDKIKHYVSAVNFVYVENLDKFQLVTTDADILAVRLTKQLSYVLGFSTVDGKADAKIPPKEFARYTCDVKGGNAHICVYAHGLIENMIVGDKLTSLLRIVSVSGKQGESVERVYDAPIFNKLLAREVHEIQIELRTMGNRPIPFDYGIVIVTLCFKKAIYF